jgi:hypothetical protein
VTSRGKRGSGGGVRELAGGGYVNGLSAFGVGILDGCYEYEWKRWGGGGTNVPVPFS